MRKQSSCQWVGVLWCPCDIIIITMSQNAISQIANSRANFGNILIYIYKKMSPQLTTSTVRGFGSFLCCKPGDNFWHTVEESVIPIAKTQWCGYVMFLLFLDQTSRVVNSRFVSDLVCVTLMWRHYNDDTAKRDSPKYCIKMMKSQLYRALLFVPFVTSPSKL